MIHQPGFLRFWVLISMLILNIGAATKIMVDASRILSKFQENPSPREDERAIERILHRIITSAATCLTASIAVGLIASWLFLTLL